MDYLQFQSFNKGPFFGPFVFAVSFMFKKPTTFQAGLCAGFTDSAVWAWPPSLDRRQDLLSMVPMINPIDISKVWLCSHLAFISPGLSSYLLC